MPELYQVGDDNVLEINLHPGQGRAFSSDKRFILVSAGSQSGKTSFGPLWLWREIGLKGPGDYLAVAPSYPLMDRKMLPEFLKLFEALFGAGHYKSQAKVFEFSAEGVHKACPGAPANAECRVFFGHADEPESLEAATAKGVWLDEAGQKRFRLGSWEAINRRVAVHLGRVLLTTTPYGWGWLKTRLYDPWDEARRNGREHPEIDVIQFDSTMNPAYPQSEFQRAERELPRWRFDMMHRGRFSRPAGLIYDCFDRNRHVVSPFAIPLEWPRYWGLDFGAVNCACVKLARDPATRKCYLYQAYWPGSKRTEAEHVSALLASDKRPERCAGGAKSENDWRMKFAQAGLGVDPPLLTDVEAAIQVTWTMFATGDLLVFNTQEDFLDELESYSRVVDDSGNPTDQIDGKESYHRLDALRYITQYLGRASAPMGVPPRVERPLTQAGEGARRHRLFGLR